MTNTTRWHNGFGIRLFSSLQRYFLSGYLLSTLYLVASGLTSHHPLIARRMGYGKEWEMAIGALIKHITKDRVDAKILLPHIIEIRSLAVRQPGYISGETFFHLDRQEECLVISRWTSLENWHNWTREPRRFELYKNIKKHLGAETEYDIYGVGLW